MKTLVVFYSFDGNTRFIAQQIAEAAGADIVELKPDNELKSHGFTKYFWGGKQILSKEVPKLSPLGVEPGEYDLLFIGSPVWAWSYTPALAAFFEIYSLEDKKIALFCCHGGGPGKTLEKMKKKLGGNACVGEINLVDPLKKDKEKAAEQVRGWAIDIQDKMQTGDK